LLDGGLKEMSPLARLDSLRLNVAKSCPKKQSGKEGCNSDVLTFSPLICANGYPPDLDPPLFAPRHFPFLVLYFLNNVQ
jgi:hypothetical protein